MQVLIQLIKTKQLTTQQWHKVQSKLNYDKLSLYCLPAFHSVITTISYDLINSTILITTICTDIECSLTAHQAKLKLMLDQLQTEILSLT